MEAVNCKKTRKQQAGQATGGFLKNVLNIRNIHRRAHVLDFF